MSTTVRPDNLKAALDAKLAAAMSQLADLREAEQPGALVHLNARESVDKFLSYAHRIYPIAAAFGREQAGDLQFDAWYSQWLGALNVADRILWLQLRDGAHFAAAPNRAASDICADYLRLAKRFVGEFVRDHARFLS